MSDDQTPAEVAGDDAISSTPVTLASDTTTEAEQPTTQAEPDAETGDEQGEETSRSKERRERRKAEFQRAREEKQAAEAKAAAIEAENVKLRAKIAAMKPPKIDDYTDHAEYVADLAAHRVSVTSAQERAAEVEASAQEHRQAAERIEAQRQAERIAAYQEQAEEARKRYADYDAVAHTAPISQGVADIILGMDAAPDVAYHLGKHPELAREISALPPVEAALRLGRIEAGLTRARARTETTAPAPINPVRGAGAAMKDPDKMTLNEWRQAFGSGANR